MAEMSLQDRYNDVARRSGLSEEIIRRVYKATKESLAQSFVRGERGTVPCICTITPELKTYVRGPKKDDLNSGVERVTYIKLKAKPSNALESEIDKIAEVQQKEAKENKDASSQLNFVNPDMHSYGRTEPGVITNQISALL